MTTLYGWGPAFDLPSPSPFVMKADIQLQMLGVHFQRALADLDSVPKHKAPYVEDEGTIIEDSTFIRAHFEKKLGVDLDVWLSEEQRGAAWALERMLEDRLHFIMLDERWMIDANFEKGPARFFDRVPEAERKEVCDNVRAGLAAMLHRHGLGRHSRRERMELAERDITAAARMLGDKRYFFGDAPTAADAAAFGELASCATHFFDTPLIALVERHANLRAYIARMRERFFDDVTWPAMAA